MRKIIFLTVIFCLVGSLALAAPTTKTLTKDTELIPQGWLAGSILFKGGTEINLNDNNEVITGTPVHDCALYGTGDADSYGIIFRGLHPIVFDRSGKVLSGTIGENRGVHLLPNHQDQIMFRSDTLIEFNSDGSVSRGTLHNDTVIHPIGWKNFLPVDDHAGFLEFDSGSEVQFGPGGQVIQGKISKAFKTISGKTFKAGTTLKFSETSDPEIVQ